MSIPTLGLPLKSFNNCWSVKTSLTGRKGEMNSRKEETTVEQRLLFLRGVPQVKEGKEMFTVTYVNVGGDDDGEVKRVG